MPSSHVTEFVLLMMWDLNGELQHLSPFTLSSVNRDQWAGKLRVLSFIVFPPKLLKTNEPFNKNHMFKILITAHKFMWSWLALCCPESSWYQWYPEWIQEREKSCAGLSLVQPLSDVSLCVMPLLVYMLRNLSDSCNSQIKSFLCNICNLCWVESNTWKRFLFF